MLLHLNRRVSSWAKTLKPSLICSDITTSTQSIALLRLLCNRLLFLGKIQTHEVVGGKVECDDVDLVGKTGILVHLFKQGVHHIARRNVAENSESVYVEIVQNVVESCFNQSPMIKIKLKSAVIHHLLK